MTIGHNTGQLRGIRGRWEALVRGDVIQFKAGKAMTSEEGNETIHFSQPRETVEARLPDGRTISGPRGAPVGEFLSLLADELPPIMGAVVNGELRELTFCLPMDSKVQPVTMGDADGMRIYRRSLTFLLEVAFITLFPGADVSVDHSVSSGGFYCQAIDRPPLSTQELSAGGG